MDLGYPDGKSRALNAMHEETSVKLKPITGRVSRAKKGVPVHTCELCRPPKTFTRAEHLRRHQLSHLTPQYPCTYPGCERAFHIEDLLTRHISRHELENGPASSTRPDAADSSRRASTTFPGHDTSDEANRIWTEPYNTVEGSFATSTGIQSGVQFNYYTLHKPLYMGHGPGHREFVGPSTTDYSQEVDGETHMSEHPAKSAPNTEPVSFASPSPAADDLLGPYQEHQKEIVDMNEYIHEKDFMKLNAGIFEFIGEPQTMVDGLCTHSGPATEKRVELDASLPKVAAIQESTGIRPPPGSPVPFSTTSKISDTDPPKLSSGSHEEIVNRCRYFGGQDDENPPINAADTVDDHVVIPTHPLDTAELATDSGYGSVQAKLDRIKSVRDTSSSARAGATHNVAESGTVYSKASTLRSTQLDLYVSDFAEELAAVLPRSLPKELMGTLRNALPYLLEAFSIKIGYSESNPICGRLMYLVHRHREQIADAVTKVFAFEEDDEQGEVPDTQRDEDMTVIDKMSLWQKQQELPEHDDQDRVPWDDGGDALDEFEDYAGLQEYCGVLIRSTAFAWLQTAMLKEIQLEMVGDVDAQGDIRDQILTALGREARISPREAPKTHSMSFQIPWCKDFLIEQEYDMPAHEALPRVLVLVGIPDHAWATTCLEYVRTIWPQSGEKVLGLLADALRRDAGSISLCFLEGNTVLSSMVDRTENMLEVTARGNAYAISEVGEILAWFQAAFQVSPVDEVVSSTSPACYISEMQPGIFPSLDIFPTKRCTFFSSMPEIEEKNGVNCCWMKLFRNPILLRGYPIPRRNEAHGGIELDLGTMVDLIGTRTISKFIGKHLIKTAMSALIPLYRKDNFISWHMVEGSDGDYMSYCDEQLKAFLDKAPTDLKLADIERSRHVVGWSACVKNVTGGPDAKYDIGWSGLKPPSPGCVLEKISIVGGAYVTAGASCLLGKKDKAVHIRSRDDYTMRLKWIAKKYVVLYDVQDRRAWLVDGTSALLHLVRASLKHDASDPFKSSLLYDPNALQEAPEHQTGKMASVQVLMNSHNVGLQLYPKPATSREETIHDTSDTTRRLSTQTRTYYCFQDRVLGISDVLEQIMAHQADESSQDGIGFRLKTSPRRQLEGFDFMDVATDEDPFWPRMTTLRATGRGWVDFTRAIHAITLFGTGFGELIQPIQSGNGPVKACRECLLNAAVPKGQDSMAVCVSELQEILQKRGSTKTSPWRLVDDIYWHTPDKMFEECQCSKKSPSKYERMQVLLPSSMPKFWTRGLRSPINLSLGTGSNGAVLFGHSRRFPLRWKNHGQPEEGPPDIEIDDVESSVRDSGLGSSISSASADNTQDRASSRSPSIRSPMSFSSVNEAGKRDWRQAFLSTTLEGIDESMAKRRKVERYQIKEPDDPQQEIGQGLSSGTEPSASAGSSRMSNFKESMSRWKHVTKEK